MRLATLILLAGCNRLLGIHETQTRDATVFDAPADAPYACPPTGTLPVFSRVLRQQVFQDCTHYVPAESADVAVASCVEPEIGVHQAKLDDTAMRAIVGLDSASGTSHFEPVVTPEGDMLLVRQTMNGAPSADIAIYKPVGGGWQQTGKLNLPFSFYMYGTLGAPSRGPLHRMLVHSADNALHELEFDADGNTTEVALFTAADLGLGAIDQAASLTPDGLRIVSRAIGSGIRTLYSDRASLSDRFAMLRSIPTSPEAPDPYLTEDCSRLYFAVAGSVFYALQE